MKTAVGYVGTFMAALAASACCWIPALLGAGAAGSLGVSAALVPWRPYLLALTAVFVSAGLFFAYRKPTGACCEGGGCSADATRKRRTNIGVMWAVAALAAGTAVYPSLASASASRETTAAPVAAVASKVVLDLRGIDCASCLGPVKEGLQAVPGVIGVAADFPSRKVTVSLGSPRPTPQSLVAAVKKAGFDAEVATGLPDRGGAK